jgi:hypothetical protein
MSLPNRIGTAAAAVVLLVTLGPAYLQMRTFFEQMLK